ncbi:caspase family protein [Rhodopseudomonas sp.]|uniref:caspase family protein n=1 Tax=Rhodopseudomonas sp. TaxID=1078 RepID=UPI0025CBDCC4|nr:caspase family protein [Rhodopseudomonas sp.]
MKRRAVVSFFLLIAILISPAVAEKRVALVIGNSAYQNIPRLDNPKNDAILVADTLNRLGFTLVGGGAQVDLDKPRFDSLVQRFGNQLIGADVALFYYAGHGIQVRGTNYLVPVTANPVRETDVDFQMVDAALVLRQMEGAVTKLNLVILDACRNNPFGGRGLRSADGGLAQMRAPEGTLLSYATQPGSVALDGDDGHSPYTKALVETVQKPGLDVLQTFNQVGLIVKHATGNSQQPWVSTSPIDGSFYFAGAAPTQQAPVAIPVTPPSTPKAPPAAKSLEQRAIEFATEYMSQSSGDASDFLAYERRSLDEQVEFYGKTMNRADVLREKEQYTARWPVRSYKLLPEATRTSCKDEQSKCQISGVVVFSASNPLTGKKSTGRASFEFGISFITGAARIFSENGKTLSAQH